jgi:hypothetical protein
MSESTVPRLALRWPQEAAQALGVGPLELEKSDVARRVRLVTVGSVQLIALSELEQAIRPAGRDDGG